ncbi:MAG: ORF6N domain-containing protein [Kiritimatiellia bacterium]
MKENERLLYTAYAAGPFILCIRNQKVIMDADLARVYGVTTKVLNQAVKRNRNRFPDDFMFQVTAAEAEELLRSRSQSVTLKRGQVDIQKVIDDARVDGNRSQIVTGSQKHRDLRFAPFVFTEHGAIMAATVLNSPLAVQMSVFVVRAFIKMREQLLNRAEMEKRLAEIEKGLMSHDAALRDLYAKIRPLLLPPPDPPDRRIGFSVRESGAKYRVRRKT